MELGGRTMKIIKVDTAILNNNVEKLKKRSDDLLKYLDTLDRISNEFKANTSLEHLSAVVDMLHTKVGKLSVLYISFASRLSDIIDLYKFANDYAISDLDILEQDINDAGILYEDVLENRISNAVEPSAKQLYEKFQSKIIINNENSKVTGEYKYFLNYIDYNKIKDSMDPKGPGSVYFHEVGHLIDDQSDWFGSRSNEHSYQFFDTLQSDFNNYYNSVKSSIAKNSNMEISEITEKMVYKEIEGWLETNVDMKSGVSDIICGLTGTYMGSYWHNEKGYYTDTNISKEAFAHFFEAGISDNNTKIDYIREVFPNAYNTYLEMVKDALQA